MSQREKPAEPVAVSADKSDLVQGVASLELSADPQKTPESAAETKPTIERQSSAAQRSLLFGDKPFRFDIHVDVRGMVTLPDPDREQKRIFRASVAGIGRAICRYIHAQHTAARQDLRRRIALTKPDGDGSYEQWLMTERPDFMVALQDLHPVLLTCEAQAHALPRQPFTTNPNWIANLVAENILAHGDVRDRNVQQEQKLMLAYATHVVFVWTTSLEDHSANRELQAIAVNCLPALEPEAVHVGDHIKQKHGNNIGEEGRIIAATYFHVTYQTDGEDVIICNRSDVVRSANE